MRKTIVVLIPLLAITTYSFAQDPGSLEDVIRRRVPYSRMRARIPWLTLAEYNAAVRRLARKLLSQGHSRRSGDAFLRPDPQQRALHTRGFRTRPIIASRLSLSVNNKASGLRPSAQICTRIGNSRFHSFYESDGTSLSGTTMRIGNFDFHNLYRSNGGSISGSSIRIGNSTFHSFYGSDGTSLSGTTTRIGNFDFHSLYGSNGGSISGSSIRIGNSTFHSFCGSVGTSLSGTTTRIGNFDFHSLYGSNGCSIGGSSIRIGNAPFQER